MSFTYRKYEVLIHVARYFREECLREGLETDARQWTAVIEKLEELKNLL